jgi:hypothetical protein
VLKNTKKIPDIASCVDSYAYQANGVLYLPHYRNDSVFIGPSYPRMDRRTWSAAELIKAGATRVAIMLWPRSKFGEVSEQRL